MAVIIAPFFKLLTEIIKQWIRNTKHVDESLTLVGCWIAHLPMSNVCSKIRRLVMSQR
jgi:hypothetical protein